MSAPRSRNSAGRFVSSKPATVAPVVTVTAKPAAVAVPFTAPEHGWPAGTDAWSQPASRKLSADERDRLTSSAINRSRVSVLAALLAAATGAAILATWIGNGDMSRTMTAAASYVSTFRPAHMIAAVEYSEPRWVLTMATNVAGYDDEISVETGSVGECYAVGETLRKLRAAVGNTDCQRTR